eukprot:scaffold337_cov393-Prasinococcus_capsulatus_cf.AAC.5
MMRRRRLPRARRSGNGQPGVAADAALAAWPRPILRPGRPADWPAGPTEHSPLNREPSDLMIDGSRIGLRPIG